MHLIILKNRGFNQARFQPRNRQKWQYFKRELVNFKTLLVPWERRIKQIESQFGSAVASYFIFLRWLFWINLVISAALVTFVAIPEVSQPVGSPFGRVSFLVRRLSGCGAMRRQEWAVDRACVDSCLEPMV